MSQGLVYSMEGQEDSPPLTQSEHSLGIGIGLAILLISILSMSILLYCCSCRENCRSRARTGPDIEQATPMPPEPISRGLRATHSESFSVLMPGDRMPKFLALPCPREASLEGSEKVVDHVEVVAQKLPNIFVSPR